MELVHNARIHQDDRGSHCKWYSEDNLPEDFQVKEVFRTINNKNTVRGMHFQENPDQEKILSCLNGSAIVNIVNLDYNSENFGEIHRAVVSATDALSSGQQFYFYIPKNHGLGYRALEDNTIMLYIANAPFSAEGDTGVDPFDEQLNLNWDKFEGECFASEEAILSAKDQTLQSLKEYIASRTLIGFTRILKGDDA